MQCRESFLVFLVFLISISSAHGDDSNDFVQTKQDEVQTIAQAAQDNYINTCEQLGTCLSPQNCSRLECYPFSDQSSETTCVYVDDNQLCTNKTGSACNTVEANFQRGYVRTPPLNFTSIGGTQRQDRELNLGITICTQRHLDETFMRVNETLRTNSSLNYFYNLYFGSVDGAFRYYPGREILNDKCGVYDPRVRPWYTGAISILKDVVVLLDTGSSMQETNFLDPTTTYMELTQTMISWFVETLTGGDRVSVIPVNASGSYPGQPYFQYVLPPNQPLDTTDPNFQGLLSYIQTSSMFSGDWNGNGGTTNFTDAFVEATSIFEDSSSPANSMKIAILVTNSQNKNTPYVNDLSAADDVKNLGSQLFVYDLNPNGTSNSSSWGTQACQVTESKDNLAINPLLFLNSYFSFLARARIAANGGPTPFWQNPYEDASDLGEVITVAYPAMSADGLQLIGVAGIDVQLAGLDSDPLLKAGVETLLTNSPYRLIAVNTQAANISICNTEYVDYCSDTPGLTESLCYPSQQVASDKQLEALLCCQDCTSHGSHQDLALVISLSLLGAVLVALLIVAFIFLWRWSKRSKRRRLGSKRNELALNVYSYEVLRKATNGFASKNVIGKGSFGVVYKAVLGDEMVAVKQLNQPADRAADFEAEIKILGITSHPNLVELKGTCFRPTQCFLVYELVNSGDLHARLWPVEKTGSPHSSDSEGERFLTWNRRRKIARGVARGLNYLHRGLEPNGAVYHLDIKPRNILLEYNCNPKIADFGISQLYEPGFTVKCASVVRGTFGYIAPEVLQGQMKPNSKLDVYSYGMVLLQLMSGRKIDDPEVRPFLLEWARSHVEDGYVEKVVDENLIATVQEEYREALMANCKQMVRLALLCLSDRPEWRPEMSEVLETIDGLQEVLDLETPSFSDWEGSRSGPADYEASTDVDFQIPRSTRLIPFSGSRELDGSFKYFRSESGKEVETTERNSEIAESVSSSVKAGKDRSSIPNASKRSQDDSSTLGRSSVDKGSQDNGSGTLDRSSVDEGIQDGPIIPGRSSVDSSLKRALEMANVTRIGSRSRTLRRSRSDSRFRMLQRTISN